MNKVLGYIMYCEDTCNKYYVILVILHNTLVYYMVSHNIQVMVYYMVLHNIQVMVYYLVLHNIQLWHNILSLSLVEIKTPTIAKSWLLVLLLSPYKV